MSATPRPTSRPDRLVRRVLAAAMATLAFGAVLTFWIAEAEACSPVFPAPDCSYQYVDTSQMPDCLTIVDENTSSMDGACEHRLEVDNQCEKDAELRFFCDESVEDNCSEDRVIDSKETKTFVLLGLSNDDVAELAGEEGGQWDGNVGLEVELIDEPDDEESSEGEESDGEDEQNDDDEQHDDDSQNDESGDDASDFGAHFEVSAKHNDTEFEDPCPYGGGIACASTSATESLAVILVFVALLGLLKLATPNRHRRTPRTDDTDRFRSV